MGSSEAPNGKSPGRRLPLLQVPVTFTGRSPQASLGPEGSVAAFEASPRISGSNAAQRVACRSKKTPTTPRGAYAQPRARRSRASSQTVSKGRNAWKFRAPRTLSNEGKPGSSWHPGRFQKEEKLGSPWHFKRKEGPEVPGTSDAFKRSEGLTPRHLPRLPGTSALTSYSLSGSTGCTQARSNSPGVAGLAWTRVEVTVART